MTGTEKNRKVWSGNEIRETFLRFFEGKGHKRVRSSSLVPHGDPTLLFTNAGMNQFKDVFLGLEKRDYNRATTAQKCVRAGGKHNDLENVGFTKRHHTFFEMLGNFSFGDYFKKEAIAFAWELVTSPDWYGIPKDKLYVTIFDGKLSLLVATPDIDPDEPARQAWLGQGVPAERILAMGPKDNFWAMGDTGPCGPCSEIHYDMGPKAVDNPQTPNCARGECAFPCDCGRYVEIWNLVFMQFNRDASGFTELPKPSVDTGLGLERVAAVLQGKISNYETDLFVPLMQRAAELCGVDFRKEEALEEGKGGAASLRVIADHARATTFLIADGVLPSNEGRGYVLRKIMRRAIRHGRLLGQEKPFLYELMSTVVNVLGDAYPEIREAASHVSKIVFEEESRFARSLDLGLKHLEALLRAFSTSPADAILDIAESGNFATKMGPAVDVYQRLRSTGAIERHEFPGEEVFRLYDTFGLAPDFIEDAVRDRGLGFDNAGFQRAMEEQRTRARASWKGKAKGSANPLYLEYADAHPTKLEFYDKKTTTAKDCGVIAIMGKDSWISSLKRGEVGEVILDRTVIYAESGGQVADTGWFYDNSETQVLAQVTGAYYPFAGLVVHNVQAKEVIGVGDTICVVADADRHARVIRNHTGTHLVHAALRNILGTHVKQSGSLNAPDRLRFDFSHFAHVDAEELRDIEQQVNDEIRLNTQIETNVTSLEDALNSGALAFFGDKYPESNVRVVTIPDHRSPRGFYSKELCGGTHVTRVGDIGVLKIVSEESVAAGVRRIEAVTGIGALEHYQQQAQTLRRLASQLNVGEDAVLAQVEKLAQTVKHLEKELEAQKRKGALGQLDDLATRVQVIKGIKVIAAEVQDVDREGLRQLVDSLRQKLGSGVVALGMPENGKVALIAGVTKDLTAKVHAGKLIGALAEKLGGKGGGRPDLAEAGGKDTAGLKTALQTVPSYIEGLL